MIYLHTTRNIPRFSTPVILITDRQSIHSKSSTRNPLQLIPLGKHKNTSKKQTSPASPSPSPSPSPSSSSTIPKYPPSTPQAPQLHNHKIAQKTKHKTPQPKNLPHKKLHFTPNVRAPANPRATSTPTYFYFNPQGSVSERLWLSYPRHLAAILVKF